MIVMIRVGHKRVVGKYTPFDIILAVIFGSVLSRAINGTAPFFETIIAGCILVGIHSLFAWVAFKTDFFGAIIKGNSQLLIKNGKLDTEGMEHNSLSTKDLEEALRLKGVENIEDVKIAYMERNGDISVIHK